MIVVQGMRHGESKTRLYQIWCDMKNRCNCKSSPGYKYYGERGIAVCASWASRYEHFRDWALLGGYIAPLELDRIDVNGNYDPSNCRWATRCQQMANTRKRIDGTTSPYKGVSWCANVKKWRAQINKNGKSSHIGIYVTRLSAALAYDDAAFKMRGEFACLNFPERKQVRKVIGALD